MPAPSCRPDPILAPLLSAKPLRKQSGSHTVVMEHRPALEKRDAEKLRLERACSIAFGEALSAHDISDIAAAEMLGVSATLIRNWKQRKAAVPFVYVMQLSEDVFTTLVRKARERMALRDSLPLMPEALRAARPDNDHFR